MTQSFAGKLLVASPALLDPNFHRSVVLICSHDESGAFGIMLNKQLPALVVDHLPQWASRIAPPGNLFVGGPVEPGVALALGLSLDARPESWWTSVVDRVGLIGLGEEAEVVLRGLEQLRVFSGYAGWGGGQLEAEVLGDSWFVVDARPEDAFSADPERLWHNVLRRQPGDLKMYAFVPPDPSLN